MKMRVCLLLVVFFMSAVGFAQDMSLPVEFEQEDIQFFKPLGMGDKAIQNRLMEIGFKGPDQCAFFVDSFFLTNGEAGINPYNPNQVDVFAFFTAPSGEVDRRNAFYYQEQRIDYRKNQYRAMRTPQPWRLRYCPQEVGNYKMKIFFVMQSDTFKHEGQFESVASPNLGKLHAVKTGTPADRLLHSSRDNQPFFILGENISQPHFEHLNPKDNQLHQDAITVLKNSGGNFTRLEISAQGSLPHWENPVDFSSKQDEMYAFDRVMMHLEQKDIYATLFRHHVEVNGEHWGVANWENNPYRERFGLTKVEQYFTNPQIKALQKWSLRYQIARWGDSPYFAFYGYSEVDNWYKPMMAEGRSEKEAYEIFRDWVIENEEFVLQECNDDIKFVHSYAAIPKMEYRDRNGLLERSEMVAPHKYGINKGVNYDNRAGDVERLYKRFNKPVLLEEFGLDPKFLPLHCCTGIEFHSAMWASIFMGSTGSGLDWWWNRGIHDFSYIYELMPLRMMSRQLDWDKELYSPQRWSDGKEDKRTIESYTLCAESGRHAAGWVKNSTIYWRNLASERKCIQHLVDSSSLEFECFSRDGAAAFHEENMPDFSNEKYTDKYTAQGPIQIGSSESLENNPILKIKDLKRSKLGVKSWYMVRFYPTSSDRVFRPIPSYSQVVSTNLRGVLSFRLPRMNTDFPDYAYVIDYLGEFDETPEAPRLKPVK